MKCIDFPPKYIGQTGRTFKTRYKEYTKAIRINNCKSGCSNLIPNTGHTYETITEIMYITKNGEKANN
jgi:hypothetical protein